MKGSLGRDQKLNIEECRVSVKHNNKTLVIL